MKIVTDLTTTSAPHRARHGWRPDWLFRGGAQGAWYDPSDLTTLFQDAGGTVPVTALNQPVGRMPDKSGNGHHATQAVGAARPILRVDSAGQHYLEFDGVDDRLVVAAFDLAGVTRMTVGTAARKLSGGAARVFIGHGTSSGAPGGLDLLTATGANQFVAVLGRSTAGSTAQAGCFIHMPPPASFQMTAIIDYGASAGAEFLMQIMARRSLRTWGRHKKTPAVSELDRSVSARAQMTVYFTTAGFTGHA